MQILRIDCMVYVEVSDDDDPEEVARNFDDGLTQALDGFGTVYEGREVIQGEVSEISIASDEELAEKGLIE